MLTHEFALVLKTEPDEDEADRLYATFQDGTISTTAGVPRIDFHREAETLVEAIRSAIRDVGSIGFDVARIELQPDAVAAASE